MKITRVTVDLDNPSSFPVGRIDPKVVDATSEAQIALQEKEDKAAVLKEMASYTRRVRKQLGLS